MYLCPRTLSVNQAALELTEICQSLPPRHWDYRCVLTHLEVTEVNLPLPLEVSEVNLPLPPKCSD